MPGEYSTPGKILQLKIWPKLRLSEKYVHNKEYEATSQ